MPGFKIWTDLDPKKSLRIAQRTAEDLQFTVRSVDEHIFTANKGNAVASVFVGALVAYCYFMITVTVEDGETEIRLERNTPWWTGLIGLGRVKTKAKDLANAIADSIEDEGGKVLSEKEY